MQSFENKSGVIVIRNVINAIKENKQYLSDIDGLIGDGDHGINMSKGFTLAGDQIDDSTHSFSEAAKILGTVLMNDIGGSMGPLYGSFFRSLFKASKNAETIDLNLFLALLQQAKEKIIALGNAQVGDKTLLDTLSPALDALEQAVKENKNFAPALDDMVQAAEAGRDSTKDMVAKVGRASRLGERSRGVLDAGSVSCCLILKTMADSIKDMVDK